MIRVKNVSAGYDNLPVIHDVTFNINRGEHLSIIGPNGCGKSTLLRVLSGVMPYSGSVELDGAEVKRTGKKSLSQKVSLLSQMTAVYFNYTVLELVMMGRFVHAKRNFLSVPSGRDRELSEEALRYVGLLELKDRAVDTLSGGQLQRVFLAKLFAQNPEVVLLDEPTNHLDLSYQVELISFLKSWAKEQEKTIIGVLHDINLAMSLSDKMMLMDNGRIVLHGDSGEICYSQELAKTYSMDVVAYMRESLGRWA